MNEPKQDREKQMNESTRPHRQVHFLFAFLQATLAARSKLPETSEAMQVQGEENRRTVEREPLVFGSERVETNG